MTTATKQESKYKIMGIIDAERPCEQCGKKNLKRNVVLERISDGVLLYVGTTCAGWMVLGSKSRKNGELILAEAKAHEYAKKWIGVHGNSEKVLNKIADGIRVHFCNAIVEKGLLLIGSETH